jgi:hypothetical protein
MEPAKPDNVAATCNTQLAQLVEAIKPLHYSEKEMEEILAGCVREIRQ